MLKLVLISLYFFISACSSSQTKTDLVTPETEAKNSQEEKMTEDYRKAQSEYDDGNLNTAKQLFDKVEEDYPYSGWAKNAQINSAYISYEKQEYDDSITKLTRFIRFYPEDDYTAYAYYMIALNYYEQIVDVGRDQDITVKAREALLNVINRYPDSKYAKDVKLKLDLVEDHLAGSEMNIGRYYLNGKEYNAALGRFSEVVKNYQTTSHMPEALHRLVEVYLILGIKTEAKKYAAVLGHNYPGSEWYKDSYKNLVGGDKVSARIDEEKESGFWDSLHPF